MAKIYMNQMQREATLYRANKTIVVIINYAKVWRKRCKVIVCNFRAGIAYYRKKAEMSQEELGNQLFVTRQTVSQWENDQSLPSIDNLLRLKEIFGVSVDKMLSTEEIKALPINTDSLDTLCAALAYAMGIDAPKYAAQKNGELVNYIDKEN